MTSELRAWQVACESLSSYSSELKGLARLECSTCCYIPSTPGSQQLELDTSLWQLCGHCVQAFSIMQVVGVVQDQAAALAQELVPQVVHVLQHQARAATGWLQAVQPAQALLVHAARLATQAHASWQPPLLLLSLAYQALQRPAAWALSIMPPQGQAELQLALTAGLQLPSVPQPRALPLAAPSAGSVGAGRCAGWLLAAAA